MSSNYLAISRGGIAALGGTHPFATLILAPCASLGTAGRPRRE
jgi:hypothetical protein